MFPTTMPTIGDGTRMLGPRAKSSYRQACLCGNRAKELVMPTNFTGGIDRFRSGLEKMGLYHTQASSLLALGP